MKAEDATVLARELAAAQQTRKPISPISERILNFTTDDAYQVQLAHLSERELAGRRQKGHKIGLTSQVTRDLAGGEGPDFGTLFDDMFIAEESSVSCSRFNAGVAVEIRGTPAFQL